MSPIPVILDTDIGTDIDDTWALAMLLNCLELEPRLVLTASGDTLYRARLAAKFLQVAGRVDVPVGVGVSRSGEAARYQEPWVADYPLRLYPGLVHLDGVDAMVRCIMASTQPVTVISIAAATNLARALELEPRIAQRCRLIGMFGSLRLGYNGNPQPVAEANVKGDVAALQRVLAAPWIETLITPLDTCGLVVLDGERYQRVLRSTNPVLKALIDNYRIWSRLVTWEKVDYLEVRSSTLFDTVAVYLAYAQDLLEIKEVEIRVMDDGMMMFDPDGNGVRLALAWKNLDAFSDHLLARLKP